MFRELKCWMERVLEKPFYDAEIMRVEILRENKKKLPIRMPRNLLLKIKEIHH